MRVSYLQPVPPHQPRVQRPPYLLRSKPNTQTGGGSPSNRKEPSAGGLTASAGGLGTGDKEQFSPLAGEALLLESLGEAVLAEEQALADGADANEAAMRANAVASAEASAAATAAAEQAEQVEQARLARVRAQESKAAVAVAATTGEGKIKNGKSKKKKSHDESSKHRRASEEGNGVVPLAGAESRELSSSTAWDNGNVAEVGSGRRQDEESLEILELPNNLGAAAAAEIGVRRAERALARAPLETGAIAAPQQRGGLDDVDNRYGQESGIDDSVGEEGGEGLDRGGGSGEQRGWGELEWRDREWEEFDGAGEEEEGGAAIEMIAMAVTLRQYPE